MNSKKLRLLIIYLLLLPLCVVIPGSGCDEYDEYSDYLTGYVVGSFIGDEVNAEGQVTGNKTGRGFCIMLEENEIEGNKNMYMDIYTFSFPDDLFVFPEEILSGRFDTNNCGPVFFPDSLKYVYKIKFKYQIIDEPDKVKFVTGPCFTMLPTFLWEYYDEIYFIDILH